MFVGSHAIRICYPDSSFAILKNQRLLRMELKQTDSMHFKSTST